VYVCCVYVCSLYVIVYGSFWLPDASVIFVCVSQRNYMNVINVYIEQALEKQLLVEQCQRVKQRNTELAVSAEQLSSQLSVRCESLNITDITCCDFRLLNLTECNYHHSRFAALFPGPPG